MFVWRLFAAGGEKQNKNAKNTNQQEKWNAELLINVGESGKRITGQDFILSLCLFPELQQP